MRSPLVFWGRFPRPQRTITKPGENAPADLSQRFGSEKEKSERSLTIPGFHRQTTPSAACGLRQALTGYFEGQVRV
jgi:hypothetical protein